MPPAHHPHGRQPHVWRRSGPPEICLRGLRCKALLAFRAEPSKLAAVQQDVFPTERKVLNATEVLFYHLEQQGLEKVLPNLVEKTLERGWRAVVQAGSPERLAAIDLALWTYKEESF